MSAPMVMCLTEVPVSGIRLLSWIITHPEDNTLSPKERNENRVAVGKEGRLGYLYYGFGWPFGDGK